MKKLIASLTLTALLAVSLGGAVFAQNVQEPASPAAADTVQGSAPAQTDPAQSMYPAVHALVLAMSGRSLRTTP